MDEDKKIKTYMVCFWTCVVIVLAVFVIPVDSHTVSTGTSEATYSYTIWDKLTDSGPKSMELRVKH